MVITIMHVGNKDAGQIEYKTGSHQLEEKEDEQKPPEKTVWKMGLDT